MCPVFPYVLGLHLSDNISACCLEQDFILFTDGIEKAEPLSSNCISIEKEVLEIEALIRRTEGSIFFFIQILLWPEVDLGPAAMEVQGLTLGPPVPKRVWSDCQFVEGLGEAFGDFGELQCSRPGHCDFIFRDLNGNVDRMLTILLIGGWNTVNTKASRRNGQNMMTLAQQDRHRAFSALTINPKSIGRYSVRINSQVARRFVTVWTGRKIQSRFPWI